MVGFAPSFMPSASHPTSMSAIKKAEASLRAEVDTLQNENVALRMQYAELNNRYSVRTLDSTADTFQRA